MDNNYISQNELIIRLNNVKISANENLLISWRKCGAIPYRKRGLGRGRGSITEYPVSSIQQIERLLRYLHEKRSLDWAVYQLWREGYSIDLRRLLKRGLNKFKVKSNLLNQKDWGKKGIIAQYEQKRLPPSFLDRARRILGRKSFGYLMDALIGVLVGTPKLELENIRAVVELLPDESWKYVIETAFQHITFYMSPKHLEAVLTSTKDDNFRIAYDSLEAIVDELINKYDLQELISPVNEWSGPWLAFGLLTFLSLTRDEDLFKAVSFALAEK